MKPAQTLIIFFGILLSFSTGCIAELSANPNHVKASTALLKRLVIAPAKLSNFSETLHLPGRVGLDEQRLARIGPSITGRITEIKAFIGQSVSRGDVLAIINSTELGSAQANYLKAKSQVGLQHLNVQRARRLFAEGIISHATLKEREGALVEADVELRAGHDQLEVMGMNRDAIDRLAESGHIVSLNPVTATLKGTVIERHVSIGQIAEPTDDLFTVADLSRLWVIAEAPERDAHQVVVGNVADVEIPALPFKRISGKIIYVADTVNPVTRTVTIRMEVDNQRREIKPEMLASMLIRQPMESGLAIPGSAIIRVGNQDFVFVQLEADRFELRQVSLGPEQDGVCRVLQGLAAGERIVVNGAFHLNNERLRKDVE